MQESKQEYTVFTKCGCFQPLGSMEIGDTIAAVCGWLQEHSYEPVAWCEGYFDKLSRNVESARDISLAAGRLIEQVDGKWLARGLEPEPASEWDAEDNHRRNDEAWREWEKVKAEIESDNAAMIARDGPAKPAPAVIAPAPLITTKPPIAGLTRVSAQDHRVGMGWKG